MTAITLIGGALKYAAVLLVQSVSAGYCKLLPSNGYTITRRAQLWLRTEVKTENNPQREVCCSKRRRFPWRMVEALLEAIL